MATQLIILADIFQIGDNNTVFAIGKVLEEGVQSIPPVFSADEELQQGVAAEGFDLSGSPESLQSNFAIVQTWTEQKKRDFLTWYLTKVKALSNFNGYYPDVIGALLGVISTASDQQLLELVDDLFFGDTQNN